MNSQTFEHVLTIENIHHLHQLAPQEIRSENFFTATQITPLRTSITSSTPPKLWLAVKNLQEKETILNTNWENTFEPIPNQKIKVKTAIKSNREPQIFLINIDPSIQQEDLERILTDNKIHRSNTPNSIHCFNTKYPNSHYKARVTLKSTQDKFKALNIGVLQDDITHYRILVREPIQKNPKFIQCNFCFKYGHCNSNCNRWNQHAQTA
jgi:hypothetical protein